MNRLHAREDHVRTLVANDAAMLHVAPPRVRFVQSSSGPCYEALFNRIEIDASTLALPESLLCIVVAHEVAHATQRRPMLLDFVRMTLCVAMLVSIPCIAFATVSDDELWRVSVPGFCFTLAFFACWKISRMHAAKRSADFEIDADAKAASIHGAAMTLRALEAMAVRGHIDAARLEAARERLAST